MKNYLLVMILMLSACGTGTAPPLSTIEAAPISPASPTPVTRLPSPVSPLADNFAVIGYFPDYRVLNPAWAKHLTDIIYFSAEPRSDGTLDTSRLTPESMQALHELKVQYDIRVHISIGGWERSSGFAAMAANAKTRGNFVEHLTVYALENDLDGVDFDWEFPEDDLQLQDYISLLKETKSAFEPHGLLVSVTLSPDFKETLGSYAIVDRIHIMSYDRGPYHSTYDQAVSDLQVFIDAGLPREKLILGVPFYGRNNTPPYKALSYEEIFQQFHPARDVDEVDGIFFNGIDTIQRKTCLAMQEGIGGVMIWELAHDVTDETSLLLAISQALSNGCVP